MTRGQFSVSSVAFCLLGLTAVLPLGTVSEAYAQTTGYQPQSPVVAAADRINPWGALAESSPFAPSPDGGGGRQRSQNANSLADQFAPFW